MWAGDAKWYKRLMSSVRMQAAYYPAFLQPQLKPDEALTATEHQILHLICAGKSNADIKLPAVKTHVSHILDKLGVSRRSEVRMAAKRLCLIPDDM